MVKTALVRLRVALSVLGLSLLASAAAADTLIDDFSDFMITGTYVAFDGGTFTSGPDDFRIEAFDFGGLWREYPAPINASGETKIVLDLDVNPATTSDKFNIVLFDGDGTERVYRFTPLAIGADQTLTKDLSDFLQDNNPGTTPGLDLSSLTTLHLQGTFENGDPGLFLDLTFDNLLLVPEPMAGALLAVGLAACAGAVRRRS